MSRNYDRRNFDKQNSFQSPLVTSKQSFLSNGELRRRIDTKLALIEKDQPNILDESEINFKACDVISAKRQNARRRGFDMKVNNIDNINQKITGLLDMVKKDRVKDKGQMHHGVAERQRRQQKSPNFAMSSKPKKNSCSNNRESFMARDEQNISPFQDQTQRRKVHFNFDQYSKEQREPIDRTLQLRSKYLQEQKITYERHEKNKRSGDIESWLSQVRKDHKQQRTHNRQQNVEEVIHNDVAQQKTNFDQMLEQRRRQRKMQRQITRERSFDQIVPQHKSAIKPRPSYRGDAGVASHKAKHDSPIGKVSQECFTRNMVQPFVEDFKHPSPRRQQSPKRQYTKYAEISYLQSNKQRQNKIKSTARIIDDQLLRVKAQIGESQTNWKRIQSIKPKNKPEQTKTKEHIIRIAENLSDQVKLDTNLKPARESFQRMNDSEKWSQFETMVLAKGMKIDRNALKDLVTIGADEHNPFGGEKVSLEIKQIVELFISSEKNWENCALKCASSRNLRNQSFQISDLDLNNKGYLGLQDLVCFVNLYANTFYRNRDLALIMRRLQLKESQSSKSGISFQTFLDAFTA